MLVLIVIGMTPTDALIEKNMRDQISADSPLQREVDRRAALIEKMARAHYEASRLSRDSWVRLSMVWDELPFHLRDKKCRLMRAAYEAEHEEDGK